MRPKTENLRWNITETRGVNSVKFGQEYAHKNDILIEADCRFDYE